MCQWIRFDHQLLTWALFQIGRGGVDRAVLDDLGSLSGRDAALDRLLGSGEEVNSEALVEVLLRLLDGTLPETL